MKQFFKNEIHNLGKRDFFPFFIPVAVKLLFPKGWILNKSTVFLYTFCCLCFGMPIILSCASLTGSRSSPREWSQPKTYLEVNNDNINKICTFSAKGYFTMQTAEFNKQATVTVLIKIPDTLKVKLEGPLGIDIATLFIDAKTFVLILHRQETTVSGLLDTLDFRNLLFNFTGIYLPEQGISIKDVRSELIAFFIGGSLVNINTVFPISDSGNRKSPFMFKNAEAPVEELYEFPFQSGQLKKVTIRDENGILRVEKLFSRYKLYSGIAVPRQVIYTFYQEKGEIGLQYLQVAVNKNIKPEAFRMPSREKIQ
jgi:hypothetical protein